MSPEEISRKAAEGQRVFAQQADYKFQAANVLKNEGNTLWGEKKYAEAVEKYNKAIENLAGNANAGAPTLLTNCKLNAAMCYLELCKYDLVIQNCSWVVTQSSTPNLKALFRRGQAYEATNKLALAVQDFELALTVAPDDQRAKVEGALTAAKEKLASSKFHQEGDVVQADLDDIDDVAPVQTAPLPTVPASIPPLVSPGTFPTMDPAMVESVTNQMRENPQMLQTAAAMMSNMDSEQLAQLSRATGYNMTPDQAKAVSQMMSSMDPNTLANMAQMSRGLVGAGANASTPPQDVAGSSTPQNTPMSVANSNPDSPVALPTYPGGLPASVSPAQMELMSSLLGKMTPEDMAKMMEMSQKMMSGDRSGIDLESMSWIMSKTDPEVLQKLLGSQQQQPGAPPPAGMAALQNMDPSTMRRLLKFTQYLLAFLAFLSRVRRFFNTNPGRALLVAIVAVLVWHFFFRTVEILEPVQQVRTPVNEEDWDKIE
eukprot:c8981_g1_i1.p1 GENE.c8981_g1_i1~~c8981_g1_i1.p1  ORF type:complete len:545 (+),score=104.79 c8981_g1_i1:183-1637(+)